VYGVRDDKGSDQQQKDSHSLASTATQAQDSRWGARRRHHHHHHHHPLSLFNAFAPFTSTFPSMFSPQSVFTPFARSLGAMPDIAIDMFSTASAYSIHAAVPGLDKRDIKITVEDNILRIEAEKKEEKKEGRPISSSQQPTQAKQDSATGDSSAPQTASSSDSAAVKSSEVESGDDSVDYHHVESFYGKVERAIALPDDADAEHLTARYENGVIKIEIPRLAEQKKEPKRVEIQ
jgi:HSP20 family protein